ncbi:hypothetical protein QLQ12_36975 [Actinoplanes sp. NEAU-A12]|uniref:Right handed beta helix domain-containing protein n=1 Tax=Actinoplanes sandaracinus TaxID=3045177 RepID=A0ABT6WWS3_9ACTN|nr:hypothetical protein [Actinoplanes sandaracinus]MDI6104199.1 hypothetical protein [Actinoplanes sandaracinus]
MRRTATLAALTAAVVTGSLLTSPSAATAGLVTHCIGTGGPVTVPNDLHVPAGESCALTGTVVTGNITVAAGANLVIDGGRTDGTIRISADGYLDARGTTIGGTVVLASGGYGVFLKNAASGAVTVRPKGAAGVDGFLFTEGARITGTVTAQGGEVRLGEGTEVTGNLNSSGTYYTDLHDSFVDGTLSVLNSGTGTVVCGSAVRGRSTFAGNVGGVQLGPNGALDSCASGGYFGADVGITNSTGAVTVDDNIIDGALTAHSNAPAAVIAASNRIRGGVIGAQPAPAASTEKRATAAAAPRQEAVQERAGARRSTAVQEAAAAGEADL